MSNQEIVDKMAAVWRSIIDLCEALTEQEWKTPTDCPGWSVQDQMAHLLGAEERFLGQPMPDHTPGDTRHVRNETGQRNEALVDWRRTWSGAQVLERFRDVTQERLRGFRAMSDEGFAQETQTPLGPGPVSELVNIRIFDAWVHEQDMRRALGRPGHLEGPVAAHAVGRIARALPFVMGRKVKPADGTTVVFEITGSAGQTVAVALAGERAQVLETAPANPTVRLTMDVETFNCLGCGRVDPAQALQTGRVPIVGDTALGESIVSQLNIMM